MAHCPPPLGTKILTIPALKKVSIGKLVSFEILTKKSDICEIIPECFIKPIIPKYKGNWISMPEAPPMALSSAFKKCLKFP